MPFNPIIAIAAGGGAFVVSFVLGLVSRTSLGFALARALLFGALFFGLVVLCSIIYDKFLADSAASSGGGDTESGDGGIGNGGRGGNGGGSRSPWDSGTENTLAGVASLDETPVVSLDETPAADILTAGAVPGERGLTPKPEKTPGALSAPPPLEQNNELVYTAAEDIKSDDGEISLDLADFVPALSSADEESVDAPGISASEEPVLVESVELSVGSKPEKKMELSDLGPNVNGKKVAQAIQTLLKKDES